MGSVESKFALKKESLSLGDSFNCNLLSLIAVEYFLLGTNLVVFKAVSSCGKFDEQ